MSEIFSSFHFVFGKKQNKNKAWSQGDLPLQQYVCTARLSKLDSPATLFKALLLTQLPCDVRRILSTSSKTEIADLALEADRITEVTRLTQDMQVNTTRTSQVPLQRTQLGGLCSGPSKSLTQMKKFLECASTIPHSAIRLRNVYRPASFKPLCETYHPVDSKQPDS